MKDKSWGSGVIPREKWVDPNKRYRTREGKKVFGIRIELHNSEGKEVTYPVKGSIDMGKHRQPRYQIWSLDGKADIVWHQNEPHPDDLVEEQPNQIKLLDRATGRTMELNLTEVEK